MKTSGGHFFFGKQKQFAVIGYYNRFKGFFVENTFTITPAATTFIKKPNLETFSAGASLVYIFSPERYSASAAFLQTERQTSSGGSFIVIASFDTNIIDGIDGFSEVPSSISADFQTDQGLTKGTFATSSLAAGYGYTLVWSKLFFNLNLLFGGGIQAREFEVSGEKITGTRRANKSSLGFSLGFNGDSVFTVLAYLQDNLEFKTRTIDVRPVQSTVRLILGVRF